MRRVRHDTRQRGARRALILAASICLLLPPRRGRRRRGWGRVEAGLHDSRTVGRRHGVAVPLARRGRRPRFLHRSYRSVAARAGAFAEARSSRSGTAPPAHTLASGETQRPRRAIARHARGGARAGGGSARDEGTAGGRDMKAQRDEPSPKRSSPRAKSRASCLSTAPGHAVGDALPSSHTCLLHLPALPGLPCQFFSHTLLPPFSFSRAHP